MTGPRSKISTSYKNADQFLEHDCMTCMESWDVPKSHGAMELCKYCRSKDIRVRVGVPYKPCQPDDDSRYTGPDIFDQYGRY